MTDASSRAPIVFVVTGQNLPPGGGSRGEVGAAVPAPLRTALPRSRGRVKQAVRVGSQRGAGGSVRVTAIPGEDAIVLHITNGPSLMLHPETARELMLAQSGRTRSAVRAAVQKTRGKTNGGEQGDKDTAGAGAGAHAVLPNEVEVPVQLSWDALAPAAGVRGAARGFFGDVVLSAIEVVTDLLLEPAAKFSVQKIGAHVDNQVEAGVYKLNAEKLLPLKGGSVRPARIAAAPDNKPVLVLLHGTFSETYGTFCKLWQCHPQRVRELFAYYGGRVYGFDHPTLTASPIENALLLARELPEGARVHLLTHSRGGLVAEVLARASARSDPDDDAGKLFVGDWAEQGKALEDLTEDLKRRDIEVERVVRVACPARGTLLASKRLDAYVSVLKWSLELAQVPVAPMIVDFLGEVATKRADPALLPGLEAMMPGCPLVQWLHGTVTPLSSQLRVVAGDIAGDSITSWVKTLLADAFYWTDNDLVVQTRSMYGGTPRAASGGKAGASFLFDRGGKVSHFNYFGNKSTADAICNALLYDVPQEFRTIGPLSSAGEYNEGVRAEKAGAPRKPISELPVVILLPGMLGSHLKVGDERIWLTSRSVGGMSRLGYHEGATDVEPDGVIEASYGDLIRFLSATHEVISFAYDWRRPMEEEARRLAGRMELAISVRAGSGQPVRLLAHCSGGLLARAVQLEQPELWQRWITRRGSRLVMLGTPNGGAWAPMQVLSGDDTLGNTLSAFSAPSKGYKTRTLMAGMPGFLQLQAGLLDPAYGLADLAQWQKLADDDVAYLKEHTWWHHDWTRESDESQYDVYRWGIPTKDALQRAVEFRRKLDKQSEQGALGLKDRIALVVGRAKLTPCGYEVDAKEGLGYLNAVDAGDGRVTLDSARLPEVRIWTIDCAHGALPTEQSAFAGYLDLLTAGETKGLSALTTGLAAVSTIASAERGVATAVAGGKALRVRSRPSRERPNFLQPPQSLSDVFSTPVEAGAEAAPSGAALRVSIVNGNLKFVSQPLMVGHYAAMALTGTEKVVDRFLGGTMNESLATGLYPEAPGTNQVFINSRRDEENPLAMPRPQAVIVAGLGQEGKLSTTELTRTVLLATLAWAQRAVESPAGGAHFELASTLIGSGGSGITPSAAAQALVHGVREANQRLAQVGWPQVGHLRLIELYLDRASEAWRAIQALAISAPEQYTLTQTVMRGAGWLRRPLDFGYRGTGYDFISAVSSFDADQNLRIGYTIDTRRARSEVTAQATQGRLVRELVKTASNDANRDAQIGHMLFQLLVPIEMEPFLGGSSEMVLELDDGAAAIPWEVLDAPHDGPGPRPEPWSIRSKLLRKLRTAQFRAHAVDARSEDHVLVIGEPLVDEKKYPPLPGARDEALAVAAALSGPLGLEGDRVHTLISSEEGKGADAAAVIGALLERRYRIVHIAGHGAPPEELANGAKLARGVVLNNDIFVGPCEVKAMRVVPELVFLNCCYLASDPDKLLKGYDRAEFAANVAKELIRVGVRCVVAAGWAVEDAAAMSFATAFYDALLRGDRFMDAVCAARKAARATNPLGNTWAAYQCYGDPEWLWKAGPEDAQQPSAPGDEFAGIASPPALTLALETLAVRMEFDAPQLEMQREKILHLEARFEPVWGGMGEVAQAFGIAYAAVEDYPRAVGWYRRATEAADGSASIAATEQLANLSVRLASERIEWELRVRDAMRESGKSAKKHRELEKAQKRLDDEIDEGRKEIELAIKTLDSLVALATTSEREVLRGAAQKRMSMLEAAAGAGGTEAWVAAVSKMSEHYRAAETIARERQDPNFFYPAMNRIAAELILKNVRSDDWQGLDPHLIDEVRQSLDRKVREDPDFWSAVGLIELLVYEALADPGLHLQDRLSAILKQYEDLHGRVNAPAKWDSVHAQMRFVLMNRDENDPETAVANKILETLRGYARDSDSES